MEAALPCRRGVAIGETDICTIVHPGLVNRHRLGLRQEELAELAGCSTRFVHTLEAGKENLRLDKLLAVLTAFGLEWVVRRGPAGIAVETSEARASSPMDASP